MGNVADVGVVDNVGVVLPLPLPLPLAWLVVVLVVVVALVVGGIWVDVGRSVVAVVRFVTLDFARPWIGCRTLDVVEEGGTLDDVVVRTELLVVPVEVVDTVVATDACRALPKGLPVIVFELEPPAGAAFSPLAVVVVVLVVGLARRPGPGTPPLPVYMLESGGLLLLPLAVVDVLVARFLVATEVEVVADDMVDERPSGLIGSLLGDVFLGSLLLLLVDVDG